MILTQQITELVADVAADMTKGQGGTSTTLFVKTQTGLQSAVAGTNVTLSDKTNTSTSISANHQITIALGNGNTLTEFEFNNGTDSYNRSVKAAIAKVAQLEYNVFHTFAFEVVP